MDSVTSGGTGTDFSQQASAQFALTSVTTSGAGSTFLTASAANSMIGNIAHVVSGTNFTAGVLHDYVRLGGCERDLRCECLHGCRRIWRHQHRWRTSFHRCKVAGSASANQGCVAGNAIWIKADSAYTIGASDSINVNGNQTNPIVFEGYNSTRGDGYLGRNTTSDGKLITTNFPSYQYSATFRMVNTTCNMDELRGTSTFPWLARASQIRYFRREIPFMSRIASLLIQAPIRRQDVSVVLR